MKQFITLEPWHDDKMNKTAKPYSSREIPGTPNSGTPIPILLLYHSHKNPLKYGNGMGSLWEGGPTGEGPWKNP